MNVKIFDQAVPTEELIVKLKSNPDGSVTLVAVDAMGAQLTGGNLVTITQHGELLLQSSISKCLGLDLTSDGKMKVR